MYLIRKAVKLLFYIFQWVPRPIQYFFGYVLGILWFDVFRIRRKIILSNLEKAFPEKLVGEHIKIGRASCVNLGQTFIEFTRLAFLKKSHLSEFKIFGKDHLLTAESKGKGVCVLTLHLGNGDYGCAGLALMDLPLVVISKLFSVKWLNEAWFAVRSKTGTRFIEPRRSSYEILKSLKAKKRVVFVSDQFMGPPIGVKTQFFGHDTGSAMGLAVMAQRSKAPVIPMYTYRNKKRETEIHVFPEVPFIEKESKEETIAHMTQVYQDHLEAFVRKHPDQWMWVHRRWKPFIVHK